MNRLEALEKIKLSTGSHASIENGACIMEMVSYLANEPWSDHPKCACPILTGYAIRLNDRSDDETREKLKAIAPKLVGTSTGNRHLPRSASHQRLRLMNANDR